MATSWSLYRGSATPWHEWAGSTEVAPQKTDVKQILRCHQVSEDTGGPWSPKSQELTCDASVAGVYGRK